MLRLIHSQVGLGALLVDDIDDGLPNKEVHRMGSTADPKAYKRDGYANEPKQKAYIPRVKAAEPTIQGFIDVNETDRVTRSAGGGKIRNLQRAGLISVVSFVPSDLATPTVGTADLGNPGVGDLTITGTGFLSLTPDVTSVILTGTGAVTLTATQITSGGGSVGATSIVILAASIPGVALATTFAAVRADGNTSTPAVALT
jgi:hypothetical protein